MEYDHHPEAEDTSLSLEAILAALEFPKTPELGEARKIVLDLLLHPYPDPDELEAAWAALADAIELIVDNPQLDTLTRTRIQVGGIIYKALLFKEAGRQAKFALELDDALIYAENEKLDDISNPLGAELAIAIETLPLDAPERIVLKLRGKFLDVGRLILLDSINDGDDFDDVLGTVYGWFAINGEDADDALRKAGLIE